MKNNVTENPLPLAVGHADIIFGSQKSWIVHMATIAFFFSFLFFRISIASLDLFTYFNHPKACVQC